MLLKLWFGTWLLASALPANAQVHSDNFGLRSTDGHRRRDPESRLAEASSSAALSKRDSEVTDVSKASSKDGQDLFAGFLDAQDPHSASLKEKTRSVQSLGKLLSDNADVADDSSQVIGAFANLPLPSDDRSKSNFRQGQSFDRRRPNPRDQQLPRRFNPRPDLDLASSNNRFFGDDRRHFQSGTPQDAFRRFRPRSDRRGFERPNRNEPTVGHSIFVNTNTNDVPRGRLPNNFRGEGPIIIQRDDSQQGRPILVELGGGGRPRDPLIANRNRIIDSKFGPVLTTVHGASGSRGRVIPNQFDVGGPPVPDRSFSFGQNVGGSNLFPTERPFFFRPNQINNFNTPSDFSLQTPDIIQVPPTTIHHSNRGHPVSPLPSLDTNEPRFNRRTFPDLSVNVDRPFAIQPQGRFGTLRPSSSDVSNSFSNLNRNPSPRPTSRNEIPFPSRNIQINRSGNERNWPSANFQGSENFGQGFSNSRSPNRLNVPFRGNEVSF